MSRGVRNDSLEKFRELCYRKKSAIGPRLGLVAGRMGVSGVVLANVVQVSYKTMYVWLMAEREIPDDHRKKLERILLLCKRGHSEGVAFTGPKAERERAFRRFLKQAIAAN